MKMTRTAAVLAITGTAVALSVWANAQKKDLTDAEYTAQAFSAAPKAVAAEAGVVRVEKDGTMRTIRPSKNGFTCLVMGTDKMCNDANSMEFIHAMMKHEPPPDKVGISYMLAGDKGASNTDPFATGKTPDNHWIVTGPTYHVVRAAEQSARIYRGKRSGPEQALHDVGGDALRTRNDPRGTGEMRTSGEPEKSARVRMTAIVARPVTVPYCGSGDSP